VGAIIFSDILPWSQPDLRT